VSREPHPENLDPRAESSDLLGRIFKRLTIERWAAKLGLSKWTLYKWAERSGKDDELPFEPSGRINPFDRVEQIVTTLKTEGQKDLVAECAEWFMRLFDQETFTEKEIRIVRAILNKSRKRRKS